MVELEGKKPGVWIDFATGESGDILHAWAAVMSIDHESNFPELVESVAKWLGEPDRNNSATNQNAMEKKASPPISRPAKNIYIDELGSPSAKWDYWDTQGNLIACVYRYDTPEGKQYRPWDVKARTKKAPDPRPLYNQLQIVKSDQVILVEGEKSADALINKGIVATTAMNGANAPVDKTDWSPLKNKHVLIWPDNDVAGQQYADRAAQAIAKVDATSVTIMQIPQNKPQKWDAFDAVEENIDINAFIFVLDKKTH